MVLTIDMVGRRPHYIPATWLGECPLSMDPVIQRKRAWLACVVATGVVDLLQFFFNRRGLTIGDNGDDRRLI